MHEIDDLLGQVQGVIAGVGIPRVGRHGHADAEVRVLQPRHVEVEDDDLQLVPKGGLGFGAGFGLLVPEVREVLAPDGLRQPNGLGVVRPAVDVDGAGVPRVGDGGGHAV